jgi:hypothetical protein
MRPPPQQALELLARESAMPVNEVARLYEDARAGLEAGARIKDYVGIFALRNVRNMLRQRTAMRFPARLPEAAGRTPS